MKAGVINYCESGPPIMWMVTMVIMMKLTIFMKSWSA